MLSIPYDPALVLGNVVDDQLLKAVLAVSAASAPADKAQDVLNALILAKRSLNLTIQELVGMAIDPAPVAKAAGDLGKEIADAAAAYATAAIEAQHDIIKAKGARAAVPVSANVESPIDYRQSSLMPVKIAADSFKMDVQYFANDTNAQSSSSTVSNVTVHVQESLGVYWDGMGLNLANDTSSSVTHQMNSQYSRHDIMGTLVITAGCTHKQAQLWVPLIIDPDKAIAVWNYLNPSDRIIRTTSEMAKIFAQRDTPGDDSGLKIISGATYGSSFVGMVHILNTTKTQSSEDMYQSVQKQCDSLSLQMSMLSVTGSFAMADQFANDAKRLLSQQDVTSHCNLVVMGVIPSIVSNEVQMCYSKFATDDPNKGLNDLMAAAAAAENAVTQTVESNAKSVANSNTIVGIKNATVKAVLDSVSRIDDGKNKVLDTNSLMTAFEDYVNKCTNAGETFGVPINYYLKNIPKSYIAGLWLAKYYPRFIAAAQGTNDQTSGTAAKKEG